MLLNEQEQLPVRVEAAIALNQLICQQPKISDYMKTYLGEIMKVSFDEKFELEFNFGSN